MKYIVQLQEVNGSHIDIVGGKNASLGEMLQHLAPKGIQVPNGFATTIQAYRDFFIENDLDHKISKAIAAIKHQNISQLNKVSAQIRRWITQAPFSPEFQKEILAAYSQIKNKTVAVRSSAIAEDLANASFAGAHETYLNIKGQKNLLHAIKLVFASFFTSRAITYRIDQGFENIDFALSAGIQPMIRSDKGASGVLFTIDTESGFDKVILITASYGLGEAIVQGKVNPDEFYISKPQFNANQLAILQRKLGSKAVKMVYAHSKNDQTTIKTMAVSEAERLKFCIDDDDIRCLVKQALLIESHYKKPMDIEWAKDGLDGQIYILQARPETVKSHHHGTQLENYSLSQKGKVLAKGASIGQKIKHGIARIITDPSKIKEIKQDEILVTDMTDPDWEPIMKRAGGIITNRGGRTCHAAIIARELGIPAIVGCGNATALIKANQKITVSCAEGRTGYVYEGHVPFQVQSAIYSSLPDLPIQLSLNVGNPDIAFESQFLPNDGVGLARLEFIISNMIGIHPNAILSLDTLPAQVKKEIHQKTAAYANPVEFYIEKLREGISMIAAAFYPKPVIFRFSDFKSNEYANLLGGQSFEPQEENPMLGYRGASRYTNERFRKCFELECRAFKRVRESMGLTNAKLMVPFVRTVSELQEVIQLIEDFGLKRGENGLEIYMMCEIPANAILAESFLAYVDGFSIGSNDLTQLVLGLDRDSNIVANLFDERNEAIKILLEKVIQACNKQGKYIGICGQAPSDHPDFAVWLMQKGIQNISLNPDSILATRIELGKKINLLEKCEQVS